MLKLHYFYLAHYEARTHPWLWMLHLTVLNENWGYLKKSLSHNHTVSKPYEEAYRTKYHLVSWAWFLLDQIEFPCIMYCIFPLQGIKSKINYTKISRQLDDALNQSRITNVMELTRNSHNKAARKGFFFLFL